MRITEKDGNSYIIFESGDTPFQIRENGTFWWSNGGELTLRSNGGKLTYQLIFE